MSSRARPPPRRRGTDARDAEAVTFDPTLDLALLRVPSSRARSWGSRPSPGAGRDRGALGDAAAARSSRCPPPSPAPIPATGRDIDGEARITRDIFELRAAVEPGDSGAPLVLEDGTVGGLVAAESRAPNPRTLAPTPSGAANLIAPAIGSRGAVDLGQRIR